MSARLLGIHASHPADASACSYCMPVPSPSPLPKTFLGVAIAYATVSRGPVRVSRVAVRAVEHTDASRIEGLPVVSPLRSSRDDTAQRPAAHAAGRRDARQGPQ